MLCGSRYAETDSYCPGAKCGTDLYAQRTGNPSYAVQAWCEPRELLAAPGETVSLTLTLCNAGTVPDRYDPNIPAETTRWLGLDRPDPSPVPPEGTRVWTLVYTLPPDAGSGGAPDIDVPIGVVSQTDARNAARAVFSVHVEGAATALLAPVPAAAAADAEPDRADGPDDDAPRRRGRRKRNPRVAIGICLAVALALLIGLVVAFSGDDGSSSSADAGPTASTRSAAPGADPVGQAPPSPDASASDSTGPSASSSADMLTVPDVVGMPQAQGIATLRAKGFQPTVVGTGDKIAATNPVAGKKVERGKPAITVTLAPAPSSAPPAASSAPPPAVETAIVPNVVDQQYAQAESQLTAAGFTVTRVDEISSKSPGTVLRTDPTGGATVAKGSRVTVTVARLSDNMTIVPNIYMKRVSEAVPMVEAAGLHLEAPYDDPDALYWSTCQLKEYAPFDGATVAKGTTIDVKRTTNCG
ncbi:MAG: PASTA domain-containing protein [Streptomycetaceae bacterium]|nr:PASTA domain-containing protein [Streptomycetaceae bacterium]